MSDAAEFKATMGRFVRARIPFVSIRSNERQRVIDLLREVFKDPSIAGLSVQVHTLTQGFRDLTSGNAVNDERSVSGAIDLVGQQVSMRNNLTFVFTDVQDAADDSPTARQLLDVVTLAEERGGAVMVVTNDPIWSQLQRHGMAITLDPPNIDEMRAIIADFLDDYRSTVPIKWDDDDLVRASTILAGVTKVEALNAVATLIAKQSIEHEDLAELSRIKDSIFSDVSGIERVRVDDRDVVVGGLEGLRAWLDGRKNFLTADLRKRRLPPPRGVLLVGVPGCGKSLSAKAIAANWELPLYRLDMGSILGQYVGQSESRLREALATADHVAPCVLWIDEIEKGLAGAGTDTTGVSTRLVGQFLYWLQEGTSRVFVVATANDVGALPGELLRKGRFDELFFVDLPTEEERCEIIEIYAQRYLLEIEPLVPELVTLSEGFSGADIDGSMREIAREAERTGQDAVDPDFVRLAFTNTVPLSRTNPERIDAIRQWGRERAVPANAGALAAPSGKSDTRRVLIT